MAATQKTTSKKNEAEVQQKEYFYALGRRKTASAMVRLYDEAGESQINGKPVEQVYPKEFQNSHIQEVFDAVGKNWKDFHFTAVVKGGGLNAQLEAIKLGLARAFVVMDSTLKPDLKKHGLLTRDPRMVERKKPGHQKARATEQFSKR